MRCSRSLFLAFWCAVGSVGQAPPPPPWPLPPQDTVVLLEEAKQLYRTGKFDAALEKYKEVLHADPRSGDAHAGVVRVYLKQEMVPAASQAVLSGAAANPDSPAVHTALGEVYFRQGRIGEAEQQFVGVINSDANEARAYLGLARIRAAISMHRKAAELLRKAHDLDASDPEIQWYWIGTLKRSERVRALDDYLAGANNDTGEERQAIAKYLERLKELQKHPDRTCRLTTRLTSTETELKPLLTDPTHMRGYGLDVTFNGRGGRLLLDTGASGLLIKKSLAERAGIAPVAQLKLRGIGDKGNREGYMGYADSIRIGHLEFKDCLVEVTSSVAGEDGLIGADVFANYLVGLDFPHQKLTLAELPKRPNETEKPAILATAGSGAEQSASSPDAETSEADFDPQDRYIAPEMQGYTRIFRFGHHLLIPTRIGDAPPKLFLIDTGAMTNSIAPEAAREITKVRSDPDTMLKGLSGSVAKVYRADKAILQFSHFRQENQEIMAHDLSVISRATGTEVSGILGFVTLHRFLIKIDYRDGVVDFTTAPGQGR